MSLFQYLKGETSLLHVIKPVKTILKLAPVIL